MHLRKIKVSNKLGLKISATFFSEWIEKSAFNKAENGRFRSKALRPVPELISLKEKMN